MLPDLEVDLVQGLLLGAELRQELCPIHLQALDLLPGCADLLGHCQGLGFPSTVLAFSRQRDGRRFGLQRAAELEVGLEKLCIASLGRLLQSAILLP